MNIFAVSNKPIECAQVLDDKRLVKMVLETAQLLSNAQHIHLGNGFYRKTHLHHPCSLWVSETIGNYTWTTTLFASLCTEYQKRYGKVHKCYDHYITICNATDSIPQGYITPFANCTPHKDMEVHNAYQLTLCEKWASDKRQPKWTNRATPVLWVEYQNKNNIQ